MALREKLKEALKIAMKAGDSMRVGVLRLLQAAINNKEIEKQGKGGVLGEEDVLQTLNTEAKKRKDSIEAFEKGGRKDLAEKERNELVIIQAYLPAQLSPAEAEKIAIAVVKKGGFTDFGPAMKEVMKELRGKADAKAVTEAVKKALGQ